MSHTGWGCGLSVTIGQLQRQENPLLLHLPIVSFLIQVLDPCLALLFEHWENRWVVGTVSMCYQRLNKRTMLTDAVTPCLPCIVKPVSPDSVAQYTIIKLVNVLFLIRKEKATESVSFQLAQATVSQRLHRFSGSRWQISSGIGKLSSK